MAMDTNRHTDHENYIQARQACGLRVLRTGTERYVPKPVKSKAGWMWGQYRDIEGEHGSWASPATQPRLPHGTQAKLFVLSLRILRRDTALHPA